MPTPAEIGNIVIALVAIGTFWLSARSAAFSELKGLFDALKQEFREYKLEREKEFDEYKKERDTEFDEHKKKYALEKERMEKTISILQESNDKKDKEIAALEDINHTLINQNDNFKRYITRLIRQLEDNKITPERIDGSQNE